MNPVPRVMAIHDLSGVGKCSLTVAIPILSAMGVEVAAMPTAVLSTHTGDIVGYTYRDLTDDMLPMAKHWQSLGLTFDALYSGWLGSARQNEIVQEVFAMFGGPDTLRFVDPVMGDHGRLYKTYTPDRVQGMARLCAQAEVITPNLTEARFLLGEAYKDEIMDKAQARALCLRLAALGPTSVVVTGIATREDSMGSASYDAKRDVFDIHEMPRYPGIWHGTGDIFGAVLLGGMLRGLTLAAAAALAVSFTQGCIARTHALGTDPRFGVAFESGLPGLMRTLMKEEDGRAGGAVRPGHYDRQRRGR